MNDPWFYAFLVFAFLAYYYHWKWAGYLIGAMFIIPMALMLFGMPFAAMYLVWNSIAQERYGLALVQAIFGIFLAGLACVAAGGITEMLIGRNRFSDFIARLYR